MKCRRCKAPAVIALPSHNTGFCAACFLVYFTRQIERAIHDHALLVPEDKVLVALSGGKDSLCLMRELGLLGYDVTGLHVDLAIPDSSDPARRAVEAFCRRHGFALIVVELAAEGLPIPAVKARLKRPICSVCGKLKRYYFNKTAMDHGFTVLATGHNLDDEVSRLFANTLRWDGAYLSDQGPILPSEGRFTRKIKPLYRLSEFETAAYCYLQRIEIHSGACPFSQGASFTGHKRLWADLEERSPGQKLAFYEMFLKNGRPAFAAHERAANKSLAACDVCGYPTSAERCGVCRIRAMLESGALPPNPRQGG